MRSIRTYILTLIKAFLLGFFSLQAQTTTDSIYIKGKVLDFHTNVPIEGVMIKVLQVNKDSVFSLGETIDWNKYWGVDTGEVLIDFRIAVPRAGDYRLCVNKKGYDELIVPIHVPATHNGERVQLWWVDDIQLYKESKILSEAVVNVSKIMMVMNNDTLIYNADAFQLAEGSLLDRLIEQLPGVKFDRGGTITVNGEFVSRLLVNGKDFFNGDAMIALRNLPAYVVKNVKVYRKEADDNYLFERDTLERKKDPLVMDVLLKKDFNGQWLTNLDVAGGSENRYSIRGILMRYSDCSRFMAFGNVNNIGLSKRPNEKGVWSMKDYSSQPITYRQGGMDFLIENKKKGAWFSTSLRGDITSNYTNTERISKNFLPESSNYQTLSRNSQKLETSALRWNADFAYPFKRIFIGGGVVLSMNDYEMNSTNHSVLILGEEDRQIALLDSLKTERNSYKNLIMNEYQMLQSHHWNTYEGRWNLRGRMKSPLWGNLMTLRTEGRLSKLDRTETNKTERFTNNEYFNNSLAKYENSQHIVVGADYEILMKKWKLIFNYSFDYENQDENRNLYWDESLSPYCAISLQSNSIGKIFDTNNSFVANHRMKSHYTMMKIQYTGAKNLISVSLPMRFLQLTAHDTRATFIHKKYTFFEPSITWLGHNGFQFLYQRKMDAPKAIQLLGYTDNSDVNAIYKGNEKLKNSITHSFNLNYQKNIKLHSQMWRMSGLWEIYSRAITWASFLDQNKGIYTIIPSNIHGNWMTRFMADYGRGLDKKNRWFMNLSSGLTMQNFENYLSSNTSPKLYARNGVMNLNLEETLNLTYQKTHLRGSLNIGSRWNRAKRNQGNYPVTSSVDFTIGTNWFYRFKKTWTAESMLNLFVHTGYDADYVDTCNLIWNISFEKSFNRWWSLRIEGYDLLGQLSNVERIVNANSSTETWRNSLPSYFMIHINFRFNSKKDN